MLKAADYNDGGGELVAIGNSGKIYTIKPTFGTFSLLDFTKNNVEDKKFDNLVVLKIKKLFSSRLFPFQLLNNV